MTEIAPVPGAAPAGAPVPDLKGLESPGTGNTSGPLPGVRVRTWENDTPDAPAAAPADDSASGVPDEAAAQAAAAAVGTHGGSAAPSPMPAKFTFGGVEFENQEKAEHSFKTVRGMFASGQAREQAARLRVLELEREMAALKNQKSEVQPPTKPNGQATAAPTEGSEQDTYAVFEVLREKFGQRIADKWLQEENDKRVESRVEAKLAEALQEIRSTIEPLRETHQSQQEVNQMAGIFQQLSTYQLPDGSVAYPELKDQAVMRDVGVLWKNLGFDADSLYTPRGVHIAIATYRDAMATRTRVATPKPASSPAAPRPAADPGVVSAGGDSPGRHPQQAAPVPELDATSARLLTAQVGVDPKLGFRVRKFA